MSAAGFALGVDIGGTTTKAAVVGSGGEVRYLATMPTSADSADAFAPKLDRLIQETRSRAQTDGLALQGIGVAVAGFINSAHDRLAYNPNLPWLEQYALRNAVARSAGALPVLLECDSNSAALAEYRFGAGRGSERFLCVTCGTGVGGGMIVDGEILRYSWECLGDIGHVIVEPGGAPCPCGGRGCLEALISADAIARRWQSAREQASPATLRDVIEAARAGDHGARAVLAEAGRLLGLAIATLTNILSPDRIAIAGGLSEADAFLLPAVRETFETSASTMFRQRAALSKATLGSHATLVGAACPLLGEERAAPA